MCGVCQEGGELNKCSEEGGVHVSANMCGCLLSCVERLPVSGPLSWLFFIWSVGAMSTTDGDTAWSSLPVAEMTSV